MDGRWQGRPEAVVAVQVVIMGLYTAGAGEKRSRVARWQVTGCGRPFVNHKLS